MFGPSLFPSQPSPPREHGQQPMSAFAASFWVAGATLIFLLIATVLASVREGIAHNESVLVGCQAAAYLLTLFAVLRVHGPDVPIRGFVALRGTDLRFFPLALVAGVSSAFWASALLEQIHRRFPEPDHTNHLAELFVAANPAGRIAMGIAIGFVGPLVEELLFRGAIFGPMLRRHPTNVVIVSTAAIFAMVHFEARVMLPIFLLGLTMGVLRAVSGSLWPSVLFHCGFNGTQFADLATHEQPGAPQTPSTALPGWQAAVALGVFFVCLGVALRTAKHSTHAKAARAAAAAV